MRSFIFRNDGIVLDRSVRSRERTIVPQGGLGSLEWGECSFQAISVPFCSVPLQIVPIFLRTRSMRSFVLFSELWDRS